MSATRLALLATGIALAQAPQQLTTVPFVGCPSGGQLGPLEIPRENAKRIEASAAQGRQLAYYRSAANKTGVLAPRGWYCLGQLGSSGNQLYVSPAKIDEDEFFRAGFLGPGVELLFSDSGASGMYDVARTILRIFPDFRKPLLDEPEIYMLDQKDFELGPYAMDILTHRSPRIIEYRTPANTGGLGTESRLHKSDRPIDGVAILVDSGGQLPHLLRVSASLPPALAALAPAIIRQLERERLRF